MKADGRRGNFEFCTSEPLEEPQDENTSLL